MVPKLPKRNDRRNAESVTLKNNSWPLKFKGDRVSVSLTASVIMSVWGACIIIEDSTSECGDRCNSIQMSNAGEKCNYGDNKLMAKYEKAHAYRKESPSAFCLA